MKKRQKSHAAQDSLLGMRVIVVDCQSAKHGYKISSCLCAKLGRQGTITKVHVRAMQSTQYIIDELNCVVFREEISYIM